MDRIYILRARSILMSWPSLHSAWPGRSLVRFTKRDSAPKYAPHFAISAYKYTVVRDLFPEDRIYAPDGFG